MKKFIISTETLSKALHKLTFAINAKTVLPVLSNIYCKVSNKVLELIASDIEITIHYLCECETSGEGFEFLIPFQLLSKIVSLNKNCPLTFSMERKDIKITGDTDMYELKSLSKVEDFPKLQELPKETSMALDDKFIPLLTTALETVSKDELRPALTKVLLELRKKEITIASTDGGYCVFSYTLQNAAPEKDDLLISPKVIKCLEGLKETKLYWNSKLFAFESATLTVIVTRPDVQFVNFRAVFPPDFDSNLKVNRYELITALEKCNINTDHFKTTLLKLNKSKDKISFISNDADYGININVEVTGNYTGPVEEVKFNSDKMLRLMNQISYDDVDLAIHAAHRAMLFRCSDDSAYIGLLMPIN